MSIKYRIIESEQLSIVEYNGMITYDDVLFLINDLHSDKKLHNCTKRLIDLRNCKFVFPAEKIANISNKIASITKSNTIEAFLIDTPKETAYSILYAKIMGSYGIRSKIFTTPIRAIMFLKLKENESLLKAYNCDII